MLRDARRVTSTIVSVPSVPSDTASREPSADGANADRKPSQEAITGPLRCSVIGS